MRKATFGGSLGRLYNHAIAVRSCLLRTMISHQHQPTKVLDPSQTSKAAARLISTRNCQLPNQKILIIRYTNGRNSTLYSHHITPKYVAVLGVELHSGGVIRSYLSAIPVSNRVSCNNHVTISGLCGREKEVFFVGSFLHP